MQYGEQYFEAAGNQCGFDRSRCRSCGSNVWPQCTQVLTFVLVAISLRVRRFALNRCRFRTGGERVIQRKQY
jgi:hypothetical protein